jgi:uncharacterized RDD family membrane protein YckC
VTLPAGARPAGFARRLASGLYELLLLTALVLIATFPWLAIVGDSTQGWRRHFLQAWVILVCGAYFLWFWMRGGQTLPMKTWRIRLVRADGRAIGRGVAVHRYLLALLGFLAAGLGYWWALWDRDGQFLHDRLAGTALVDDRPVEPAQPPPG